MKTRNCVVAMTTVITLLISMPSSAATISYGDWSKSGSDTVIPSFTINDNFDGKFQVNINIDKVNSANDFAVITGIFFDLGSGISETDITGESLGNSLSGHTDFATNTNKIKGVTAFQINPSVSFDTVLGYKSGNKRAEVPISFFVSDHNGALTLNDWGKVGVRFQSVGVNDFGGGSDKEMSTQKNFVAPVPAAVWLFGSGLIGLVGAAKRRKKI